ncbi:hypothetical protein AA21952_3393 [Acetobacter oeni LMG 21952]|nr:hypothetical protein AA21952_3393 [Acetobacter oeni LMG 21952]
MSDGPLPIEWRQSTRARRVSLRVSPRARQIIVTLPASASAEMGLKFLQRHTDWIEKQLKRRELAPDFEAGGLVPLNGAEYLIRHSPLGTGGAWLEQNEIHVSGELDFIPRRITDFLRQMATRQFNKRVTELAGKNGITPAQVAIRDTTSRWGSCTATGRIMLSWRLIMTPPLVQDYVIFHELAHICHLNHSAAFWKKLDSMTPHRMDAELWLRLHGAALMHAGSKRLSG